MTGSGAAISTAIGTPPWGMRLAGIVIWIVIVGWVCLDRPKRA
jgi:hypothetical protein